MATVYSDFVLPETSGINENLNLGAAGDTVVVTAGASLNVNTVKDSGGNTLWTSDGSGNLSSMNSAFSGSGKPVLVTNNVFTNATTSNFTVNNTYTLYIFKFIDIHADNDNVQFNMGAEKSSGWSTTKMTTFFSAEQPESGNGSLGYNVSFDNRLGTGDCPIAYGLGNGADNSKCGELYLFDPSNATYVTNFYATITGEYYNNGGNYTNYCGGYLQDATAYISIRFGMSAGTMDGIIKMYGLV